ncbi:hypothetical protein BC939DRAFT_498447 [Gamsiella multidivaricata]|uniref:uncharacterized protein n=1 Tax=Gamsiella multidivaricata TaxID=101098 RepID=UPI002221015C|nr:uncharacterized protein BC939DRAFT_498447 [Gamsiella multidivaricata]KAG0352570.1 hypothetical protein BGZ54_002690 [Gamsiella multidivaricata]KAI7832366.1 hypothetical protein BC939DRAFT_498447 [Gamsiella multidivaricata]
MIKAMKLKLLGQNKQSKDMRTLAVMFIGRSLLLENSLIELIGGDFPFGEKFKDGPIDEVSEAWISVRGRPAVLMDVPYLLHPHEEITRVRTHAFIDTLKADYDFRMYYVMQRGVVLDEDLVLMSKLNDCVRQAGGAKGIKLEFRIIVDGIRDEETYKVYETSMKKDKLKSFLANMKDTRFSFEIPVKEVILVRAIKGMHGMEVFE